MRIAARRVSLKPLPHEVPMPCGMVQQERPVGFGGDIREPLQTGRWSEISSQYAASLPAPPDRHPNRRRAPGVASADRAASGVMSDRTSRDWLVDRSDRSNLVLWLAVNAAHGSEFLFRMLADLLEHGFLSEAQEAAVRRCRSRSFMRKARFWPSPRRRSDRR